MQVFVRDNNVDQALKALKKKMQREGIFREMKLRGHYEKPSQRRVREKVEAIRRARKLARKKLQREGLLPMKPRTIPGRTEWPRARWKCTDPGHSGPARAAPLLSAKDRHNDAGDCAAGGCPRTPNKGCPLQRRTEWPRAR